MDLLKRIPFLRDFRDPIWQSIGALLTLLAIVVSTIVSYDIYLRSRKPYNATKLSIVKGSKIEILQSCFKNPLSERLSLTLDGEELDTLSARFSYIQNTGDVPILPEDFLEPLRVRAKAPWKIVEVSSENSVPPRIETTWTAIAESEGYFELEPLLLNPGDRVDVIGFVTLADGDANPCRQPDLEWSGRIIGVRSFSDQLTDEPSVQKFLNPRIQLSGWLPYYLVMMAMLLLAASLVIGVRSRRLALKLPTGFLVVLVALFSFSTSEILVSYVWKKSWWSGSAVIVVLHLLLAWYICWPAKREEDQGGDSNAFGEPSEIATAIDSQEHGDAPNPGDRANG